MSTEEKYSDLQKLVELEVRSNEDIGYYLIVLKKDGETESFMATHPQVPLAHLFEHVVPTLADDMNHNGFTIDEVVEGFLKKREGGT